MILREEKSKERKEMLKDLKERENKIVGRKVESYRKKDWLK